MKKYLFAVLLVTTIGQRTFAADVPALNYRCVAQLVQDWAPGSRQQISAKSKEFFVTDKDYSAGKSLSLTDFVVRPGQNPFQGTSLESGFDLWITIRGTWGANSNWQTLFMESLLTIPVGSEQFGVVFTSEVESGIIPVFKNQGTIYLSKNVNSVGPIHYSLKCYDELNSSHGGQP